MVNKRTKPKNIKKFLNPEFKYKKYNTYNILLFILLLSFSISIEKVNSNNINKLIYDSEIILTIRGTDRQKILNTAFGQTPSEIFVNGNKTDISGIYVNNLSLEENNIKIIFNETLRDCSKMFFGISMKNMFSGCSNLISLDLCYFDSSSVKDMSNMFKGCSNLCSLDLSHFDTSSVSTLVPCFLIAII